MKCPACDEKMTVTMDEPMGRQLMCACGVVVSVPYDRSLDSSADVLQKTKEKRGEQGSQSASDVTEDNVHG